MESMELKNLISSSETVDVYRVGDMAIKLFKEGCRKTMPLYEALTHSRVEDTGLNIPIIREVSVINNRWAIQMDLIEGKTLADIMKEDPDHMDDYLNQMVDIQLEIHSKKVPKLSKLKDKLIRQINELDCIDDVKKYEMLTRLDSMPKHIKLCHGNFTPENIIINDKGTYVVDWVAARQGNASADVAKTYLLLSLQSKDIAERYMNPVSYTHLDVYKRQVLIRAQQQASSYGIEILYHNHTQELQKQDGGSYPLEEIGQCCPLELDTYWAFHSGQDLSLIHI